MTRASPRRNHGTVYLLVMVTISLVTLLALSGITAARVQGRTARSDEDALRASALALSAFDLALHQTIVDTEWRKTASTLVNAVTLDGGSLKVDGSDPLDADLIDSDDDPVLIRATATAGDARRIYQAFLDPEFDPLSCLADALVVGGNATFSACTLSAKSIHIGAKCTASSAMIAGHLRAGGAVAGSSYLWTVSAAGAAPSLPLSADLAWYSDNGTAISYASINSGTLERCVLSPASNPFGVDLDERGIYVIDCANQKLTIRDCRIVGTLVLKRPASGTRIMYSVLFEPAVNGFPSLIVLGDMEFDLETAALSESSHNTNFNPTGTPFQGVDDADKSDSYTPAISGLVYVSGNATVDSAATLNAPLIIAGNLTATGPMICAPSWDSQADPPPAFRAGSRMVIRHGSIVQVVD